MLLLPLSLLVLAIFSVAQNTTETEPQPEPEPIPCKPGLSFGKILIRTPNATSVVFTGIKYNVSWEYDKLVTVIPSYLDVYLQMDGVKQTWNNKIAENVDASQRWFIWEPKAMLNGRYRMRMVPEGKETYNVPANKLPCFENGEAVPTSSWQPFKVVDPNTNSIEYPDTFGPTVAWAVNDKYPLTTFLWATLFLLSCITI